MTYSITITDENEFSKDYQVEIILEEEILAFTEITGLQELSFIQNQEILRKFSDTNILTKDYLIHFSKKTDAQLSVCLFSVLPLKVNPTTGDFIDCNFQINSSTTEELIRVTKNPAITSYYIIFKYSGEGAYQITVNLNQINVIELGPGTTYTHDGILSLEGNSYLKCSKKENTNIQFLITPTNNQEVKTTISSETELFCNNQPVVMIKFN